jgi:hypothetical protein
MYKKQWSRAHIHPPGIAAHILPKAIQESPVQTGNCVFPEKLFWAGLQCKHRNQRNNAEKQDGGTNNQQVFLCADRVNNFHKKAFEVKQK